MSTGSTYRNLGSLHFPELNSMFYFLNAASQLNSFILRTNKKHLLDQLCYKVLKVSSEMLDRLFGRGHYNKQLLQTHSHSTEEFSNE